MIKSSSVKWAGHVTCERGKRNVCNVLVGKPRGTGIKLKLTLKN